MRPCDGREPLYCCSQATTLFPNLMERITSAWPQQTAKGFSLPLGSSQQGGFVSCPCRGRTVLLANQACPGTAAFLESSTNISIGQHKLQLPQSLPLPSGRADGPQPRRGDLRCHLVSPQAGRGVLLQLGNGQEFCFGEPGRIALLQCART